MIDFTPVDWPQWADTVVFYVMFGIALTVGYMIGASSRIHKRMKELNAEMDENFKKLRKALGVPRKPPDLKVEE